MRASLSLKSVLVIAFSVIAVLCLCRLARSGFDASYFITAGSDYINGSQTPAPVIVQPGQGYDGQFFYRFALQPFDYRNNVYGINIDHPPYRAQRIGYPLLAHLVSAGVPALVPWAMVLVNMLAFTGIFYFVYRIIAFLKLDSRYALLPLLLFGLYMSVARDLAEVTELFFLTGCLYAVLQRRELLFSVFATSMLLCRDTSVIALLPLVAIMFLGRKRQPSIAIGYMVFPFVAFAIWKAFLYVQLPSIGETTAGYHSFGLPFKGMVDGFIYNADVSSLRNILQLLFWIAYLVWTAILAIRVVPTMSVKSLKALDILTMFQVVYLAWLFFAVCFSFTIYVDDWGFLRVFSMMNLMGLLILVTTGHKLGKIFITGSALLVLLTLIRLVINV